MSLWFRFHVGGQESEHWEQTWFFTYRARMETQQSVIKTLSETNPVRFSLIDAGPLSSPEKTALLAQQ